ncbi:flavin reductase [Aquabacterium sp. A7-Y]|uniref:flavin reductase n=1 Tax=Aquabacterium sp. A7-Y TaxID=1349605 RepID=UPI00223E3E04|nr:flavin reductase [Aquabacterium sp. A7-Y]MCW7540231.1 flavin reductase [Aquabacterium sp. A7-Y]
MTDQDFRNAMAALPAGVAIITTDGPGGRRGMTATALCSVSDAPPTMLVCVNRQARSHAVLQANGVLAINVLAAGQDGLARRFGGATLASGEDPFGEGQWEVADNGVPILSEALVSLHGQITGLTEVATHTVLYVTIVGLRAAREADAVVYFRRRFCTVEATV